MIKMKIEIENEVNNIDEAKDVLNKLFLGATVNIQTNELIKEEVVVVKQEEAQPVQTAQEETPVAQGEMPAQVATVLPTAEAKEYSFEEIAKAMVQLRDLKGSDVLMSVLNHFNVKALTEIPKDKYNELVTMINEKGVKI